ncbi:hypothetical protein HOF78_01780 [Candidatus Woesearchaeota archaeon]|jgi:hypothetical protein|nr:hypothetical protein [Candidatus Woesearchaeota archaeon]
MKKETNNVGNWLLITIGLIIIISFVYINNGDVIENIFNSKLQDMDSDNDTIPDKLDEHPFGDGRKIIKIFNEKEIPIDLDIYDYYRNKPRVEHGGEYVTISDPSMQVILEDMFFVRTYDAREVKKVMRFVEQVSYIEDAKLNFDDYPKYPVETLVEQNGDCEDTSYLMASLLGTLGFKTILLRYDDHIAIAVDPIKLTDLGLPESWFEQTGTEAIFAQNPLKFEYNGSTYFYVETTGKNWKIGEVPEQYKHKEAKIIPLNYNTDWWNTDYAVKTN